MSSDIFTDYYEDLQISPNADNETLERVYRLLAKRYHPDNDQTGDTDRFNLISRAFEILSDPEKKKTLKPVKDPALTIAEIETIIREQITVTDAQLRLLAIERAQQVKNYLLQDKSIAADRLFLTEPKTLSPEKKGEFKTTRVELNVR